MEARFVPADHEDRLYAFWSESGFLHPPDKGKPFTILMPPPNANASLHAGHGMYTVEDIMIRYQRLKGKASWWIPGMDHAGFETQYVYEKNLSKQGRSRLDFDRDTLYRNVYQFVQTNSGLIYQQFRRLGFLADWGRSVFTLDQHVLDRVFQTFAQMEHEGFIYRDDYIVNYCTHCGTSLSELEVKHVERIDPLYYLRYGPFVLATVRPETKFGDTALAVHPKDQRYRKWVGKTVEAEGLLGKFKIRVITDESVDRQFGTGVVKITPAHDPNDFKVGKKHHLELKRVINIDGRLNELTGPYSGMKVKPARAKIVADLKARDLIEKVDEKYLHSVTVCYKCGRDLEPTVIPNWFIKVQDLKKPVIQAVRTNKIKFYPPRYKKQILQWLRTMHDWPISRQIAWGIRIPVWYEAHQSSNIFVVFLDQSGQSVKGFLRDLLSKYRLSEIEQGLQELSAPVDAKYVVSQTKPAGEYLPETDTFDTWFSSGQWPLVTLKDSEYQTHFPTDIMGTLAEILPFWVSRMIMFSLYVRKEVPFKTVYLWSMVVDAKGQKMSKSKGNVINPIDLVKKYGADAFRGALLFGVAPGGRVPLAEDKVRAMRNFANKVWNIARFLRLNQTGSQSDVKVADAKLLSKLTKETSTLETKYQRFMDGYKFSQALGDVYEFLWHRFADYYLEQLKETTRSGNMETLALLQQVLVRCLRMLHPFMPFVTEAIYQEFEGAKTSLLVSKHK